MPLTYVHFLVPWVKVRGILFVRTYIFLFHIINCHTTMPILFVYKLLNIKTH